MIFNNDRTQYSTKKDNLIMYEFLTISNITMLEPYEKELIPFLTGLKTQLTPYEKEKVSFLFNIQKEVFKVFIIHQENVDMYFVLYGYGKPKKIKKMNFKTLQNFFQDMNNIDGGKTYSKRLASSKEGDFDPFVNDILKEVHNLPFFKDDNGLALTKQLLGNHATKGFDMDLFQYIPSTNEYIIYEFLKREKDYVTNVTAHPMRYSWKEKESATGKDNRQKFIALWKAKKFFNAKLFLISYSDKKDEKISVMETVGFDEEKGILEEKKYCMSQNMFVAWLKDMNTYSRKDNNYLSDFKMSHYDKTFFQNFKENKKQYGQEFRLEA